MLEVATVRFHRATGSTMVEGLIAVPFAAVSRLEGDEQEGFGAYRLTVTVQDTAGLVLTNQTWLQRVPARLMHVAGGSAVEHFRFAVQPGRYTVAAVLTDSASGRVLRGSAEVAGFAQRPPVSDLLVSPAIRAAAGPDDTVAIGGELRRGGLFITVQPEPVLTPTTSNLFYYLELYGDGAMTAGVAVRVLDLDGTQVIARPAEDVAVPAGGGIAASGVSLAGLPEGRYRLAVVVTLPETTLTRTAAFRMAGFATAQQAAQVARGGAEDFFATQTEAQLDTLYAPLLYIMERDERGVFEDLSLEGKRNYLRQFWARRDPTPGTVANETQSRYYNAIAAANREFAEGGGGNIPGWRTDRGRIYLRYGPPDEVLRRPQAGTLPYEVWKYTRGRSVKFVFLDRTGLGNYQLIYTDDRREPSLADWEDILGPEAVEDVRRF